MAGEAHSEDGAGQDVRKQRVPGKHQVGEESGSAKQQASETLAPGIPGPTGFILAGNFGTRSYTETEVALQWTLYDFGRTGGRYRDSMTRLWTARPK